MNQIEEKALRLDAEDTLSSYKQRFHFPIKNGKKCIYLCGNSIGLQPLIAQKLINEELKIWRERGVEGYLSGDKPWVKYHHYAKDALTRLVGGKEIEVIAMNNLTTNLHLAITSFYQPNGKRNKILIEKGAFPSDFYVIHSQMENKNLNPKECLVELSPSDGADYLSRQEVEDKIYELGEELSLVLFPGVQYYTGQFFDIKSIAAAARKVGAYAGFDLAHAIGNVPLSLHADEVDFAVWCSYKYLNSGPGGVGGLYIHERHVVNTSMRRLSGWWGHGSNPRFKMENTISHLPTVDGWQLSSVNIISQAAHLASLKIFDEVGMGAIRKKSILLTSLFLQAICKSEVISANVKVITPTNPDERGNQLLLVLRKNGREIAEKVGSEGVILDWKEPNAIRVAFTPLYTSFFDVAQFAKMLEWHLSTD